MHRRAAILLLLAVASAARGDYLGWPEQARSKTFWPADLPFEDGLYFYSFRRADVPYYVEGKLPAWWLYGAQPRVTIPPIPGGMDRVAPDRWFNLFAIKIPSGTKVELWSEWTTDARGQKFRQVKRSFPVGTVSIDVLCNLDGKRAWPFEVRRREKTETGWESTRPWRSKVAAPLGYAGPGRACGDCHSLAEDNDTIFTWRPFSDFKVTQHGNYVRASVDEPMLNGWDK